jgi:microcystin-dependent protein
MSEPFLSEIKLVSFNFPPKGWALCNGQLLPINQNQALFALLGTTYGGNGQTNFALPNLRGTVPIHMGGGHTLGEKAGSTSVTINAQSMATHIHSLNGRTDIVTPDVGPQNPTGQLLAGAQVALQAGGTGPVQNYAAPSANLVALNTQTCSFVGGSQPHNNMMPYLVLNFIIALQGIFPSRN